MRFPRLVSTSRVGGALAGALLCLACDPGGADGPIVEHPTPENTPAAIPVASRLRAGVSPDDPGLNAMVSAGADGLLEVRRIGLREGSDRDILGFVQDIAEGPDGTLFVLDSRLNRVSTYGTGVSSTSSADRGGAPRSFRPPRRWRSHRTGGGSPWPTAGCW